MGFKESKGFFQKLLEFKVSKLDRDTLVMTVLSILKERSIAALALQIKLCHQIMMVDVAMDKL